MIAFVGVVELQLFGNGFTVKVLAALSPQAQFVGVISVVQDDIVVIVFQLTVAIDVFELV